MKLPVNYILALCVLPGCRLCHRINIHIVYRSAGVSLNYDNELRISFWRFRGVQFCPNGNADLLPDRPYGMTITFAAVPGVRGKCAYRARIFELRPFS